MDFSREFHSCLKGSDFILIQVSRIEHLNYNTAWQVCVLDRLCSTEFNKFFYETMRTLHPWLGEPQFCIFRFEKASPFLGFESRWGLSSGVEPLSAPFVFSGCTKQVTACEVSVVSPKARGRVQQQPSPPRCVVPPSQA